MSEKNNGSAAEVHKLQQELDVLKEQMRLMAAAATRQKKVTDACENLLRVFGEYTCTDNRKVPALITAVFQTAGVVDIIAFDCSHSGGLREIVGIELGAGRNEIMPYLSGDEEEQDGEFVAS